MDRQKESERMSQRNFDWNTLRSVYRFLAFVFGRKKGNTNSEFIGHLCRHSDAEQTHTSKRYLCRLVTERRRWIDENLYAPHLYTLIYRFICITRGKTIQNCQKHSLIIRRDIAEVAGLEFSHSADLWFALSRTTFHTFSISMKVKHDVFSQHIENVLYHWFRSLNSASSNWDFISFLHVMEFINFMLISNIELVYT